MCTQGRGLSFFLLHPIQMMEFLKEDRNEFMQGRYEYQYPRKKNYGGSREHTPSYSVGQSHRLATSGRVGPSRPRENKEEILVVRPKAKIKSSFSSNDSLSVIQVDRQAYRNKNKNYGTLPGSLRGQYYVSLEISRPHQDRRVQKSSYPETHKAIADYIVKLAISLDFADPSKVGIDSTVQEANISYPSDATLMKKLALKAYKLLEFLKEKKGVARDTLVIDIKEIVKKYQQYAFMAKNTIVEKNKKSFENIIF